MSEFFLRFVNHEKRESYEALGWSCVGAGAGMGSHGYWSCLMKWTGEGEPIEPASAEQAEHAIAQALAMEGEA